MKFENEVADLNQKLLDEKAKLRQSWKTSCEQLMEQDTVIAAKDEEIAELKRQVADLTRRERERREKTPHHLSPQTARVEPPPAAIGDPTTIASTSRPPGHRTLPGAPPHSSGGRARHPSSGDDSTLGEDALGRERPRPGDLSPTMFPPGLTHPEHSSHLRYEEPAYLDRTRRGRAPPIWRRPSSHCGRLAAEP